MNHLKRRSSPPAVWCSLMLFFPFTQGTASVRPPPEVRHGCLKHQQRSRGCLERDAGRAQLTPSPPPCWRSLPSSLAELQITEFLPHWHCQALTVVFICIVLVVNWFKCYGNDIYLFSDPVSSKQAGLFPPWLRDEGLKDVL